MLRNELYDAVHALKAGDAETALRELGYAEEQVGVSG